MGQIILVQLPDDLVHLLLLGFGGLVHIHGGIHEVPQGEEGFILLRADCHIPVAVGEDAVYHGGDAGDFVWPSTAVQSFGRVAGSSTPARTASSMSWLT